MMWLWETKLAPWAEVHLETRDLQEFSRGGYLSSYRGMAACLKERPYLAGAFSASWLNDPQLALISPHLGFVERTGYESGAELIKLRTEAEQIAFAAARSPRRRKLIEKRAIQPEVFWAVLEEARTYGMVNHSPITLTTSRPASSIRSSPLMPTGDTDFANI